MRPTLRTLFLHGGDILKSPGMQIAKENMQHGSVSVFEHSVCVALVDACGLCIGCTSK